MYEKGIGMKSEKLEVFPQLDTSILWREKNYEYEEIVKRINIIKTIFNNLGIEENSLIGLLLERSEWQVICPISVLDYNCGYVPLNISWPVERIRKILKQTNPSVIIIDKQKYIENKKDIRNYKCKIVYENIAILVRGKYEKNKKLKNVAYIIFTSGTTGEPKGVVISRSALQRFKENYENRMLLQRGKSILSLAEYSFDMFVPEGILALSWGIKIVLAETMDIINPRRIERILLNHKPDYMQITPSALNLIFTIDTELSGLKSISKLMVGAERFPEELFIKTKRYFKGNIYNLYGPTEATVWCCGGNITNDKYVNIGVELGDCKVAIIDEERKEDCEKGEICISGMQLADGYWNNEEETKNKFYFVNGERFYRSGDIGYRDKDGKIICLGRKDDQIKLHGYRIELAEIESITRKIEGVVDALASVAGEEEEKLILFLIVNEQFKEVDFWDDLGKSLPAYEMPVKYFLVDEFAYSENGKINRKKMIEIMKESDGNEFGKSC